MKAGKECYGPPTDSLNNGFGSKIIRLWQGLESQGNNNAFVIGLWANLFILTYLIHSNRL